MIETPDRLYIDKKDKDLYDKIKDDLFKEIQNKDQFLVAMAYGYKYDAKIPLDSKEGYVRTEYLSPEDKALMDAIALSVEDSVDILANKELVFSIAEEFAHGGIKLIHDQVISQQYGSFIKTLEKEIMNDVNKLKSNKNYIS